MTDELFKIADELKQREVELYAASIEFRDYVLDAAQKRASYDVDYAKSMLDISNRNDKDGMSLLSSLQTRGSLFKTEQSLGLRIAFRAVTSCGAGKWGRFYWVGKRRPPPQKD